MDSTNQGIRRAIDQISTGRRTTRAADDPAGAALEQDRISRRNGLRVARGNISEAVWMLQIADTAASEIGDRLKRMHELAIRASSGSTADTERSLLNEELGALGDDIERVAEATAYNGLLLTNSSGPSVSINVSGGGTGSSAALPRVDLRATAGDMQVGRGNISIATAAQAQAAVTVIQHAVDYVNGARASYGAAESRLTSALRRSEDESAVLSTALAQIRDADLAYASAKLARLRIIEQTGIAVAIQGRALAFANLRWLL